MRSSYSSAGTLWGRQSSSKRKWSKSWTKPSKKEEQHTPSTITLDLRLTLTQGSWRQEKRSSTSLKLTPSKNTALTLSASKNRRRSRFCQRPWTKRSTCWRSTTKNCKNWQSSFQRPAVRKKRGKSCRSLKHMIGWTSTAETRSRKLSKPSTTAFWQD